MLTGGLGLHVVQIYKTEGRSGALYLKAKLEHQGLPRIRMSQGYFVVFIAGLLGQ